MIAVRVRDECERLRALRIEPQVMRREMQPALMEDGDHADVKSVPVSFQFEMA